jgi:O-antigen/teichoic acid export membrane protein
MTLAHVDRFALGIAAVAAEVGQYAVAIEVVTKVWLVVGALIAAVTPRIARGWSAGDSSWKTPFSFAVTGILVLVFALHALFTLAGSPLLQLWLGASFDPRMATLLAILSIGITINGISQANYLLILIAGGERDLGWLQIVMLPLTLFACLLAAERFGAPGVAWVFTGRMILDAFVMRYLIRPWAGSAGVGSPALIVVAAAAIGFHLWTLASA